VRVTLPPSPSIGLISLSLLVVTSRCKTLHLSVLVVTTYRRCAHMRWAARALSSHTDAVLRTNSYRAMETRASRTRGGEQNRDNDPPRRLDTNTVTRRPLHRGFSSARDAAEHAAARGHSDEEAQDGKGAGAPAVMPGRRRGASACRDERARTRGHSLYDHPTRWSCSFPSVRLSALS
jgi:hypothetical protein